MSIERNKDVVRRFDELESRMVASEIPSAELLSQLYELISGYRVSQAIYVVARLDIAGLLSDGPRTSDELAAATGAHAGALYRVLRFLAGVGLFEEVEPHRFGLTPLGAGLRPDIPASMRPPVLHLLDPSLWESWGELLYSVQTGDTAFEHVHGMGHFDYLQQHPDAAATFNQSMTSNTARSGTAITREYDFSGVRHLVDVGGGHGRLLATILLAYPAMRGTLFDRPEVVAGAAAVLEGAGVAGRCDIVAGDFFTGVPAGGDAYVLRQIIHDWDDDRASRILQNCRRALDSQGKVLVVERRLDRDYRRALPVLHIDMQMLVSLGGRERTHEEYDRLFADAGFRLTAIVPLNDPAQFAIFEGHPI